MSNLKDRAAARRAPTRPPTPPQLPPLVPARIRALYAEALMRIPRVGTAPARDPARAPGRGGGLPAVGSFFA